jgi:signal transduction histidine kinase
MVCGIGGEAGDEAVTGVWREVRLGVAVPDEPVWAVSWSLRGQLWMVQRGGKGVWASDGYASRGYPGPLGGGYAIYESRTGQLWAMHPEGLQEYRRDAWQVHRADWVRFGRGRGGGGGVDLSRPLPLLAAERDRVLVLLPDRMLKHDTVQGVSVVLREAAEAGLGEFVDFLESRDGDVWVVGERGACRLPGPVRRLSDATPWAAARLTEAWGLRLMGRGFELEDGRLVVMGEREGDEGRAMLLGDGTGWSEPVGLPAGAEQVWGASGGRLWSRTARQVFRLEEAGWREVAVPHVNGADLYDVAVDSGGAFWLATSRGVIRHGTALWERPSGAGLSEAHHSILELPDGGVWFAGRSNLVALREGEWRRVDGWGATVGRLHRLGSGLVTVDGTGSVVVIEPTGAGWRRVESPDGGRVREVLGLWTDGRLVVQVGEEGEEGGGGWWLAAFDGASWERLFEPTADWELGNDLRFIHTARSGTVWLGTGRGLAVWNERIRAFARSEGFPVVVAASLIEVGGGRMWCATGREILEWDGRAWMLQRPAAGPVEKLAVLRDGSVWAWGSDRLLRQAGGAWVRHDGLMGMVSEGIWDVWRDERGELWVATGVGIRRYRAEADLDPPRSEVTSPGGRRQFRTTERTAILVRGRDRWDQSPADRLLYARRLNGGPWSAYGSGTVLVLTNLTAGEQRLEVRAMDPALNEELEPAVFEFLAYVPWYAEPRILSVTAVGVLVAGLLAGLAINRHFRLRRGYAEVERMVRERTRELERANAELVHSQKMRALGTLAAGIAHDFNSILSIIRGSAQIIEANPGDAEKIGTRVDRIKKMVDQGASIVKAMLGLSRVSQQERRWVEVAAFLEETARLISDQLPGEVGLHIDQAEGLPRVRVVPDLLRQVLINLVFNAGEAMGGKGEILLRAWPGALPETLVLAPALRGPQVVIQVVDRGQGMEPAMLARVFEPFFTTKAFSTRRGTGLGLTMVFEIARELGLGLGVESVPGRGSVFSVYVPVGGEGRT